MSSSLPWFGDVIGGATGLGATERLTIAYRWAQTWCRSVPGCNPKLVDVYGFSRGAAMARTFVNLVLIGLMREFENVSVRFLGVYDTVSSFGACGDDVDVGQNMCIRPGDAAHVRHYTARLEIRENLPADRAGPRPELPRGPLRRRRRLRAGRRRRDQSPVVRAVDGHVPFQRLEKEYLDKDIVRNGWDKIIQQIFLPVEKVYKVVNGKKVMRERNFYPGYIMMEVAEGKLSDDIIQHVSNISNVFPFLTDGKGSKGNIISLRKAEVNKMLGKVDEMSDAGGVTMSEPFITAKPLRSLMVRSTT